MPVVSVVIPVYNVEAYLAASLESVRRQELSDIEIICVNDGSTDGSAAILELFASVEPRIVVVDKPNGGLSSARNAGIDAATGDYVCFLDSDDLLVEQACSTIAAAFERTGADVVTYGGLPHPLQYGDKWLNGVLSPREVEYSPFHVDLLFKENSSPFAWRTACRLSFLRSSGLRFDETLPFGEDQAFHFALYPRSPHTALIPNKLVRYRAARPGSFMDMRRRDPVGMARDHVMIADHIMRDWGDIGFLRQYPFEAADWASHFALLRALQLDDEDRNGVLDDFAAMLRCYFDDVFLKQYAAEGLAGPLVAAAIFDRELAFGNKRRAVVYRYLVKKDGRWAVALSLLGRLRGATIGRVANLLRGARSADNAHRLRARDAAWERKDEDGRQRALEAIRREAAAVVVTIGSEKDADAGA